MLVNFQVTKPKSTNNKGITMRETRNAQASIFDHYAKHEIGNQLAMMSTLLDNCGELVGWVKRTWLVRAPNVRVEPGFPWKCAALRNTETSPAAELQGIGILPGGQWQLPQLCAVTPWVVVKSALQDNISRIKPQTGERINQALVGQALAAGVECNRQVG